jgi:hypothetical protein
MKKILVALLVAALFVPGTGFAKAKKAKVDVPEWAVESERCSGDKDVKNVSLGREAIWVSEDLGSASYAKDSYHAHKHTLVYFCADHNYFRKTPGVGPKGDALTPGFKHGDNWYALGYDAGGNLTVNGIPAIQAPVDYQAKAPKKNKKGKKSKK